MTTYLLKDFTEPFLEQNPVGRVIVYSGRRDLIIGNYFLNNIRKEVGDSDTIKFIARMFSKKYPRVNCVNVLPNFRYFVYDEDVNYYSAPYYNSYAGIYISDHTKIMQNSGISYDSQLKILNAHLQHYHIMECVDEVIDEIYFAVKNPDKFISNKLIYMRVYETIKLYRHIYDSLVKMMVKSDSNYGAYWMAYDLLMNKLVHIKINDGKEDEWLNQLESKVINDDNYEIVLEAARIINYDIPIK